MLAAVGCGGSSKPPVSPRPTTMLVGSSGGLVSTSDGSLTLDIPPGALADDIIIAVQPRGAPAAGALGTVFEIGPTGLQFAVPVTLTLRYDAAALTGADKSVLRVATYAAGAWQLLPGAIVDTRAETVSGVTTHLSTYTIVSAATGKTCAQVPVNVGCTGAGDGGTLMACGTPRCADATSACTQYPGAAMDSCLDGQNGYTASCCFPSGAPTCFAIASVSGCGGTGCPPPPTCATATAACAAYPGATLEGCTDSTNGYSGACCFATGAPTCIAVNSARACADGDPCAGYAGATVQSCTDTAGGSDATCCFAVGTLPIARGGSSGGSSGGTDAGAPDADGGDDGGAPD